jgi:hypothetical protein
MLAFDQGFGAVSDTIDHERPPPRGGVRTLVERTEQSPDTPNPDVIVSLPAPSMRAVRRIRPAAGSRGYLPVAAM